MKKKNWINVTGKKYDGFMGRCYRETDRSYPNYGGKGVKVCSDWIKDIQNFRDWVESELESMGVSKDNFSANSRLYTVDRIDNSDHYRPGNCRLVNLHAQGRNKSNRTKREVVSCEGEVIII